MEWTVEERAFGAVPEAFISTDKRTEALSTKKGEAEEVALRWTEEKKGPDIVVEEGGLVVSRSAHYGNPLCLIHSTVDLSSNGSFVVAGWGTQLTDRWFSKGEGIYVVELLCENMDDLGVFIGVMDRKFLDDRECRDWDDQLRDVEALALTPIPLLLPLLLGAPNPNPWLGALSRNARGWPPLPAHQGEGPRLDAARLGACHHAHD